MTTRKRPPVPRPHEIARALTHPIRWQILEALEGPGPSGTHEGWSPSELAHTYGVPVNRMSYHVRQLAAAGLLELKATEPRRGAVEHYYERIPAVGALIYDWRAQAEAWARRERLRRNDGRPPKPLIGGRR